MSTVEKIRQHHNSMSNGSCKCDLAVLLNAYDVTVEAARKMIQNRNKRIAQLEAALEADASRALMRAALIRARDELAYLTQETPAYIDEALSEDFAGSNTQPRIVRHRQERPPALCPCCRTAYHGPIGSALDCQAVHAERVGG